ncbi:MAG: hypothetical protein HON98_00695 [Chloroflexi bacterium]|jgi:succinate dehydrogenase / fumarate reductase, membrane anchor subunit|nr:hypothetical protein [Chloroflexota bacterium]MBT4002490.1 hypothetical protein [Chloroflexota bacterium]MBT4306223.1 hypothetical protein [Chloroflexota bacterium]MBT4534988.1 hypothetical protein [Chloroflexota bacterium]MBT4754185.1 hypothetical protein [Chloroflexota bacterium]
MTTTVRKIKKQSNFEITSWKWMRYSAVALLPLVWIHVLIKDVIVGVHNIDTFYVRDIWAIWGWKVYDILLLAFTFAHGVNGLRNVSMDFFHSEKARKIVDWGLIVLWVLVSGIGALAIIAGARPEMLV